MATREKKPAAPKKPQCASPQPPIISTELPSEPDLQKNPAAILAKTKKLNSRKPIKRLAKKSSIQIKLRGKAKAPNKINPKLAKRVLDNSGDKKLVNKNGIKRKRKVPNKLNDQVLEPIFPSEENVEKKPKKGVMRKKNTPNSTEVDLNAVKKEPEEDPADITTITKITKKATTPRGTKKPKQEPVDSDTLDDVINDLNFLINQGDLKKEVDTISESGKSDTTKPRKLTKKQKFELLKKEIKKENIELDSSARKVIDMLDLNVKNITAALPTQMRRHSIEKFPISGHVEPFFTNIPRSISPRSKRGSKLRGSVDSRRSSPYSTRSDSPARILRNGKHRKLKQIGLLDGLEPSKKRKRLCSDLSGSESKQGYESDSSFSDMASLQGDPKDLEVKKELITNPDPFDLPNDDPPPLKVKRSLSSEAEKAITDTNSNVCSMAEMRDIHESNKVPEKNMLLDIMKQNFNESTEALDGSTESLSEPLKDIPNGQTPEEQAPMEIEALPEETVPLEEALQEQATSEPILETIEPQEQVEVDPEALASLLDEQENIKVALEESPEELAAKESILKALGLQSLKAAEEAKTKIRDKPPQKEDIYTGTLKAVIKVNRDRKKGRNSLKMTLQKKTKTDDVATGQRDEFKIMKEGWKQSGQSSDTAGAHRKSHYSNRSNLLDGSSEHTSDGETQTSEGPAETLVIPEKASSFSIHPERLCKDECTYCFGKFGLFDTPCHIAQMKSVERQDKILATEKHLTRDSCLCDACYRHIDRKSNTPSYTNKSNKRGALVAPGPRENHCHVLGCGRVASNILRRKWIIKMKSSITQVINIDLNNPGLHSIPICDEHYVALEHLMVCAMCKRRLARNHIHYIGPEVMDLNAALNREGIPLNLTDKPVVCKLCKCFATIVPKNPEDRPQNCENFFKEYKKRLLHFNNIVPMDEAAAEEPITVPSKEKTDSKKRKKNRETTSDPERDSPTNELEKVPSSHQKRERPESPSDYLIDYNTLIPSIAMDCESDQESKQIKPSKVATKMPDSVELRRIRKSDLNHKLNPALSVRQLFPGEEELGLQANIEFNNVREKTIEGWEKCASVIQFDKDTKLLWDRLQKPYGNQSSFLRHLILLEKYFRNGDLELSARASHQSMNYSESVQNRLRAYDNVPSNSKTSSSAGPLLNSQAVSMIPFSRMSMLPQKSSSGIITSANKELSITNIPNKNVTLTQIPVKSATKTAPPGLISLQPGTSRPVGVQRPHSQKIKFPITKNWRPNLIPIDTNKQMERKVGLVQVISGGKPYHITLEDYKKMCAIKRSFELKQKRLQEAQQNAKMLGSLTLKSSKKPALTISKTKVEAAPTPPQQPIQEQCDNFLEKLDKQLDNLEARLKEKIALPKIPRSLTVIPQTIRNKPGTESPALIITKPKNPIKPSS